MSDVDRSVYSRFHESIGRLIRNIGNVVDVAERGRIAAKAWLAVSNFLENKDPEEALAFLEDAQEMLAKAIARQTAELALGTLDAIIKVAEMPSEERQRQRKRVYDAAYRR